MEKLIAERDQVTEQIIECAIEVHRELGPGLLERPYLLALAMALKDGGMTCEVEKTFPIIFRGKTIGDYRTDLIVANYAVVEIKSIERYDPVFLAQLLTYLRVTGLRVGLIINFNRPRLCRWRQTRRALISLKPISVPLCLCGLPVRGGAGRRRASR